MPEYAVEPIQMTSAAELVSDRLRRLIVTGVLSAGEPLRETQLAKRMEISRNSLREGIRLLEQSRLVKYELHRGAVVTTPSVADLADVFRTRRHIELAAVRVEASDEQLATLSEACERLEATAAGLEPDQIIAADLALHQAIVGLLRSERLSAFYDTICKELIFYFAVLSHTDEEYLHPQEAIVDRHREIVDALVSRRTSDAEALLLKHIDENESRLRDILTVRADASEPAARRQ
ncbi:FCD domain-containing protein [Leucobacter sp. gxy201]|uniref:GntR family transcriptional regulator n=1 Tax=Leucobacter sp. gxy201 TaxID=2957200 RepID=UPI003DA00A74